MKYLGVLCTLLVPAALSAKVVLLVLDGLTQPLLDRISTPALDAVAGKGVRFLFKPEFPADTLPSLQAAMTGQHTEMTGVLGPEVNNWGKRVTPRDVEFWMYNPNISTIAELTTMREEGHVGCIQFPGCQFYPNQDKVHHWGTTQQIEHTVLQTTEKKSLHAPGHRLKRSLDTPRHALGGSLEVLSDRLSRSLFSDLGTESTAEESGEEYSEPVLKSRTVEQLNSENKTNHNSGLFFNKTTDKEWLDWTGQVETLADWLAGDKPVNLVLYYLSQPADKIRAFGPESPEADLAVYKVDQFVGYLLDVLERRGLLEATNLVITGLHGFTEVSAERVLDISNLVDTKDYKVFGHSPVLNLQPVHVDKELDIFAALQRGDKDKFDLYNKHGIPAEYHYKNNDRVTDIVLVAKQGFAFSNDFYTEVKEMNLRENRKNLLSNRYGFAGYDNSLESMQSILLLMGPGVLPPSGPRHSRPTVQAVDVFPLLSHLIGVESRERNGSLEVLREYLVHPPSPAVLVIKQAIDYIQNRDVIPKVSIVVGAMIALLLVLIGCFYCCCRLCPASKDLERNHTYRYSQVKSNRRHEARVDGSEDATEDKVGLLTSAIMLEDADFELPV